MKILLLHPENAIEIQGLMQSNEDSSIRMFIFFVFFLFSVGTLVNYF